MKRKSRLWLLVSMLLVSFMMSGIVGNAEATKILKTEQIVSARENKKIKTIKFLDNRQQYSVFEIDDVMRYLGIEICYEDGSADRFTDYWSSDGVWINGTSLRASLYVNGVDYTTTIQMVGHQDIPIGKAEFVVKATNDTNSVTVRKPFNLITGDTALILDREYKVKMEKGDAKNVFSFVAKRTGSYTLSFSNYSDVLDLSMMQYLDRGENGMRGYGDQGNPKNGKYELRVEKGKRFYLVIYLHGKDSWNTTLVLKDNHTHIWDQGKVTKEPTCVDGIKTYTCLDGECGATRTEVIPANKEHSWSAWKLIQAGNCTKKGKLSRLCTVCGAMEQKEKESYDGHQWGNWSTVSAATVFEAESRQHKCGVCGKTEVQKNGVKLSPTMKVSATSVPLKVKQKTTKVTVSDLAAGDYVKSWESSNKKIVKVNEEGRLTAGKKPGKAVVTVTLASGLTKDIKVTVQKGAVKTKKIKGVPKKLSMKAKETYDLAPVISPITSQDKIKYTTSNKKVATVNSKGKIKAKKKGNVVITIKCGSKSVKCKIKVK